MDTLMVIDLEASGLGVDGWPAEIGLAWIEDGTVRSAARLIRPDPDWSLGAWSPESADVQGIPLDALMGAEPAVEVARWAAGIIGGAAVVSDAPMWDRVWLRMLLATAGIETPSMLDFDRVPASRFDSPTLRRVYAELDRDPAPHRAGPDAARLAQAWLEGLAAEGGAEGLDDKEEAR